MTSIIGARLAKDLTQIFYSVKKCCRCTIDCKSSYKNVYMCEIKVHKIRVNLCDLKTKWQFTTRNMFLCNQLIYIYFNSSLTLLSFPTHVVPYDLSIFMKIDKSMRKIYRVLNVLREK